MNSPVVKRIISAFIAILLLVYVGNQIYNANYAQVRTETAINADTSDTAQTTAVVIRNEKVITQTASGIISYALSDGSSIAKGGVVADLYNSAKDATVQQQLTSLQSEIERLKKLNDPGDTFAVSLDSLDKQIDQKLTGLLGDFSSNEYNTLSTHRQDLLYLLNERQIVTKKVANFNQRISQLQSQYKVLAASGGKSIGQIKAPASGFFISAADGYESLFDYNNVLALTASDLKVKQNQKISVPNNVVGKICENFDWYLACVLPADTAAKIKRVSSVNVVLPFASTESVPAQVAAVNQTNKDSEAAVILKCSYMNSSLADIRNETVQIQIQDYSGIRVSQQAIHFAKTYTDKDNKTVTRKETIKGVYVMHGSEIEFVQIVPIFSSGSYVICDMAPNDDDILTKSTLKLYDEVVTEGTDLYDGKIVK